VFPHATITKTSSTDCLSFIAMLRLLFHLCTLVALLTASPTQISPEWQLLSFNVTLADFDPKNGPKPGMGELRFELQESDTKNVFLCERDFNSLDPKWRNAFPVMLPLKSWQSCTSKTQRTVYFKVNNLSSSDPPVIHLDIFQMIVRNDSYVNLSCKT
jgi:hypothetical protein